REVLVHPCVAQTTAQLEQAAASLEGVDRFQVENVEAHLAIEDGDVAGLEIEEVIGKSLGVGIRRLRKSDGLVGLEPPPAQTNAEAVAARIAEPGARGIVKTVVDVLIDHEFGMVSMRVIDAALELEANGLCLDAWLQDVKPGAGEDVPAPVLLLLPLL